MTLKIIGAGFGRTGTLSTRAALERLGLAPCYHMSEVFQHPEHIAVWHAAARGEAVDWQALLGSYGATIDWPASHFWRQLMTAFPDARVLLTTRTPESWWNSFSETILTVLGAQLPDPALHEWPAMVDEIVTRQTFCGRPGDREHAMAAFRAYNEEVIATVPADRLLVFEARQGWAPLCAFLGVPVPDEPFPRVNDTAEFKARAAARREGAP